MPAKGAVPADVRHPGNLSAPHVEEQQFFTPMACSIIRFWLELSKIGGWGLAERWRRERDHPLKCSWDVSCSWSTQWRKHSLQRQGWGSQLTQRENPNPTALTERENIFVDLYQILQSPEFLLVGELPVCSLQISLVLSHLTLHPHVTNFKWGLLSPQRWRCISPCCTQPSHPPLLRPAPWEASLLSPQTAPSHPTQGISRDAARQAVPPGVWQELHLFSRVLRSCDIAVGTAWNGTGRSSREEERVWMETITTTGTPPAPAGAKMLLYHSWVQQSIWPGWDWCQQPRMG